MLQGFTLYIKDTHGSIKFKKVNNKSKTEYIYTSLYFAKQANKSFITLSFLINPL